ncbi:hypothetical protein ABIB35_000954 [Arthrobacter sp. UYP6]
MDMEIQLINDGDGLAVIGDPGAVERFLVSENLPSKYLGLHRLGPTLGKAAGVAELVATAEPSCSAPGCRTRRKPLIVRYGPRGLARKSPAW